PRDRRPASARASPALSARPLSRAQPSLRLLQRTDRENDARSLAAPDRQMRLGQIGQYEGDGVVARDAKAPKQVAGLRDGLDELAMRPHNRILEPLRLQEERERRRIRRDRS